MLKQTSFENIYRNKTEGGLFRRKHWKNEKWSFLKYQESLWISNYVLDNLKSLQRSLQLDHTHRQCVWSSINASQKQYLHSLYQQIFHVSSPNGRSALSQSMNSVSTSQTHSLVFIDLAKNEKRQALWPVLAEVKKKERPPDDGSNEF